MPPPPPPPNRQNHIPQALTPPLKQTKNLSNIVNSGNRLHSLKHEPRSLQLDLKKKNMLTFSDIRKIAYEIVFWKRKIKLVEFVLIMKNVRGADFNEVQDISKKPSLPEILGFPPNFQGDAWYLYVSAKKKRFLTAFDLILCLKQIK